MGSTGRCGSTLLCALEPALPQRPPSVHVIGGLRSLPACAGLLMRPSSARTVHTLLGLPYVLPQPAQRPGLMESPAPGLLGREQRFCHRCDMHALG